MGAQGRREPSLRGRNTLGPNGRSDALECLTSGERPRKNWDFEYQRWFGQCPDRSGLTAGASLGPEGTYSGNRWLKNRPFGSGWTTRDWWLENWLRMTATIPMWGPSPEYFGFTKSGITLLIALAVSQIIISL